MTRYTFKRGFTTSKNIDNPEYYFQTSKVKFIPGKKVTGLTNMVIADVPTIRRICLFSDDPETNISESFYPAIMIQITEVSLCKTEVLFCSKRPL
jgi:hypothetical protein